MVEQLNFFNNDMPQIGQKIEYICVGKKYKGIVTGYSDGNNYIDCTTNERGFSGVSLHILNKGKTWFTK